MRNILVLAILAGLYPVIFFISNNYYLFPGIQITYLLTLIPFDLSPIVESARRTGRVIILHEARPTGGFGAELAAVLQDRAFGYLHAPVDRVAGHDLPYSFSTGDQHYKPSDDRIRSAIRQIMEFTF